MASMTRNKPIQNRQQKTRCQVNKQQHTTARDVAHSITKTGEKIARTLDARSITRASQKNERAVVVCINRQLDERDEIEQREDGRVVAKIQVAVLMPKNYTVEAARALHFSAFGALAHPNGGRKL